MNRKMNRKVLLFVVAILVIGSSTVFAADNLTTLKGWFADIKIFNNGQQVQLDTKPLVINNTTYIPVRALANVLNKDIEWKQDTSSIHIADKPDANYNYVLMQLFEKQEQITKLEARVKELEAQLEAKTTKVSSLSDMQNYLNKEYGLYENIDFNVVVSGSASKITVKIYVDKGDNSRWKNLSSTKIKNYVQDIVDDVKYYFPKASIEGYIENDYNDRKEVDFYVNSSGKLVIDTDYYGGSSGSGSRYDLEDDLNYYYGDYDGIDFYFTVDEYSSYIDIVIEVDEYYWNRWTTSKQNSFLKTIYNEASDEFPKANIYIDVIDYYTGSSLKSY